MFFVLSTQVAVMACIVTPVASATACAITSFAFEWPFTILCIFILSAYVCLFETFTLTPCYVFMLLKITLVDAVVHIYCYNINLYFYNYVCAC